MTSILRFSRGLLGLMAVYFALQIPSILMAVKDTGKGADVAALFILFKAVAALVCLAAFLGLRSVVNARHHKQNPAGSPLLARTWSL